MRQAADAFEALFGGDEGLAFERAPDDLDDVPW